MAPAEKTIVHVDHETGWSGGQTQVMGLMLHQQRGGCKPILAAPPKGELAARASKAGIAVHPLKVGFHFDPLAGLRLRHLLSKVGCDIVHFHTSRAHALALWMPRRKFCMVVTRRMDYRLRGGWLVRRLYNRRVDRVVAISNGVKQALVDSGVALSRITVIHSGVDLEAFEIDPGARARVRERLGAREGDFLVLVPAALEIRKGHSFLFFAVRELLDSKVPVVVVCCGNGSQRSALEALAGELEIAAAVRFPGFVSDIPEMLAASDAVVLPSLQEGLGVAVLEAMAAARPVVATDVGGIPEVLAHGDAGIMVGVGNPPALAAALKRLASDRELACALGESGRERVREHFSLEVMASLTEQCYGELLGGRS